MLKLTDLKEEHKVTLGKQKEFLARVEEDVKKLHIKQDALKEKVTKANRCHYDHY